MRGLDAALCRRFPGPARLGRPCLAPLSRVCNRPLSGHGRFTAPVGSLCSRCRGLLRVEKSALRRQPGHLQRWGIAYQIRGGCFRSSALQRLSTPCVWIAQSCESSVCRSYQPLERVQGLGFSQFPWSALPK